MNLYRSESADPLRDAQRNLSGRTHYVDDNTLRFFKSRILSTHPFAAGLLFGLVESVAADPDNKRRGFRAVIFDVFGTVLTRRDMDQLRSSSRQAYADLAADAAGIDAHAHTLAAIKRARQHYESEMIQFTLKVEAMAEKKEAA